MNETLKLAHIAAHLNAGVILVDPPPPGISVPASICIPLQRQPGVKKKKRKKKKKEEEEKRIFFSFFLSFFFLFFLYLSLRKCVERRCLKVPLSDWRRLDAQISYIM